ncbi:MAG: 30S ribosomal protein S2 [Anaerolineales bacterium]|uniref:Small ribosomal subunit protein uS2 n=1 Tax=Candidatus Desulfolinea nitratireducens TaxID=2841698 RepID=A0A8J6THA1_9CHLR|nr:30S ribosomal protein S2 [Candidatus Desulfolinea nitratireducens]
MAVISMKALLESGVHFGHRTNRWHPKMKPYIFTERNGIHIIDLQQTVKSIHEVYGIVSKAIANGGEILFVGTKRQAQQTVADEASRCGMPYVNERWLGGSLTNWPTIYLRIQELERLETMQASGEVELLSKKEGLMIQRQIDRLHHRLSGLLTMKKVPQLLFVVDIGREQAAIHEANLLKIPVIAMADTNYDPRYIDYVIPSNDDAIRAIKLIVGTMANAVLEGKSARQEEEAEAQAAAEAMPDKGKGSQRKEVAPVADASDLSDEELLGAATLEKMSAEREAAEAKEEKAAEAKEEEKATPAAEEAKEEKKAAPKAEAAKVEEEAAPKADAAKEEVKAAPETEEAKDEEKAAPKAKKAPAKKKAAAEAEDAKEEKKAAPKAKKAPAKKKAAAEAEDAKEEKKAAPKAKKAPAKKKAAAEAEDAKEEEKAAPKAKKAPAKKKAAPKAKAATKKDEEEKAE